MDSTLNVDAVCMAIRDVYAGRPKMSMEDARTYFLAQKTYFVHERAKAYQEQFLSDLRKTQKMIEKQFFSMYKRRCMTQIINEMSVLIDISITHFSFIN